MHKRHAPRLALFAVACLALAWPTPGYGAAPAKKPSPYAATATSNASSAVAYVEDLDGAKVNWADGRLAVSGIGTPGDRGPVSYRRKLAERAAVADAYRRMAATLEVVRVDTNQHVKDLAVIDDALRSRLNDFVKTARVLETNYWPDGTAEVVLEIPLRGDRSLVALAAGTNANTAAEATPGPTPKPVPSKEVVTAPVAIRAGYTAVIVDAHGVGAAPALMPNLRDHAGKVVDLDTDSARTIVKYVKDGPELDAAAGLNPLMVRATRTQGPLKADLVLTPDTGEALKAALRDKKLAAGVPVLVKL